MIQKEASMSNNRAEYLQADIAYVADLVAAGIDGVISGWQGTDRRGPPRLTREIWAPIFVGASIGVLSTCLTTNRPEIRPPARR